MFRICTQPHLHLINLCPAWPGSRCPSAQLRQSKRASLKKAGPVKQHRRLYANATAGPCSAVDSLFNRLLRRFRQNGLDALVAVRKSRGRGFMGVGVNLRWAWHVSQCSESRFLTKILHLPSVLRKSLILLAVNVLSCPYVKNPRAKSGASKN